VARVNPHPAELLRQHLEQLRLHRCPPPAPAGDPEGQLDGPATPSDNGQGFVQHNRQVAPVLGRGQPTPRHEKGTGGLATVGPSEDPSRCLRNCVAARLGDRPPTGPSPTFPASRQSGAARPASGQPPLEAQHEPRTRLHAAQLSGKLQSTIQTRMGVTTEAMARVRRFIPQ